MSEPEGSQNIKPELPGTTLEGRAAAERYIELLTGSADTVICWDWSGLVNGETQHARDECSLDWERLSRCNANGMTVFCIPNAGGQKDADITSIRALYADSDGVALSATTFHVRPHFIVWRDDTHWHPYWLVDETVTPQNFRECQRRIIAHYKTDPVVHNPARCMRVPGFDHWKSGSPIPVKLLDLTEWDTDRYCIDRVMQKLPTVASVTSDKDADLDEPDCGWDPPGAFEEFVAILKNREPAVEDGEAGPQGVSGEPRTMHVARSARDHALSPERCLDAMTTPYMLPSETSAQSWNDRCDPPWDLDELSAKVNHWYQGCHERAGCRYRADLYKDAGSLFDKLSRDLPDDGADKHRKEQVERRARFHLRTEAEQGQRPPRRSVIRNVLYRGETTLIYGPEDSFKSFVALDLALSACAGIPWAPFYENDRDDGQRYGGFAVDESKDELIVLYIAGEGVGGIETGRRPAWRQFNRIAPGRVLRFYTVEEMPVFSGDGSDLTLLEFVIEDELAGATPDVVIFDTVARALDGLDENSAKDVGVFIKASDRLKRRYDCSVIHVHHTSGENKNPRGSTRIRFDAEVRIKADCDAATRTVTLTNEKNKDSARWPQTVIMRATKPVTIQGTKDEDGNPVTSLVLKRVMQQKGNLADGVPVAEESDRELVRQVAGALRKLTSRRTVDDDVLLTQIDMDMTVPGGPWEKFDRSGIETAKAALRKRLREGAHSRPGRKGRPPVPALLGRFCAIPYVPKVSMIWRLPETNAAEVPTEE